MIYFGIFLAAVSLAAFILYGADKSKARGLLGMVLFRHKTRHWYFWTVNFVGLAWQLAALFLLLNYGVAVSL